MMNAGQVVPITPFIYPSLRVAETLCSQIQHTSVEATQAQMHQILQGVHPAVAVYDLFESGKATAFWKDQLNKPSVTDVGRAVDDFCRKIFALNQFVKSLYNRTFNREVNSRIAKRDLSSDALNCSINSSIIHSYKEAKVDISFTVEQKNGKCERIDPGQYGFDVSIWDGYGSVNQTICKILTCVKDKMSKLQDLIPCFNAPVINRTYDSKYTIIMNVISFKYFIGNTIATGLIYYKNQTFHDSSTWQHYQVVNTIADSLYQCEQEQIVPTNSPTDWLTGLPTIVKVVILMSAVSFIPVVGFTIYKLFSKKEGEQQPLITQE